MRCSRLKLLCVGAQPRGPGSLRPPPAPNRQTDEAPVAPQTQNQTIGTSNAAAEKEYIGEQAKTGKGKKNDRIVKERKTDSEMEKADVKD